MTDTTFITLTVIPDGHTLVVNAAHIIDVQAFQLIGSQFRDHAGQNTTTLENGCTFGNGARVTIKGRAKDRNPVIVEQSPEDIFALLQEGA
jgi:hypothetical protein